MVDFLDQARAEIGEIRCSGGRGRFRWQRIAAAHRLLDRIDPGLAAMPLETFATRLPETHSSTVIALVSKATPQRP